MSTVKSSERTLSSPPGGYTIRPTVMDDLKPVVELLNTWSLILAGANVNSEQGTVSLWSEPDWDASEHARSAFSPEGELVGWLETYDPPPHLRKYFWIHVHPDHLDQGIEEALYDWARAHAESRLHLAPEGSQVVLESSMYANHESARALCEAVGMLNTRHYYQMEIEMDAPPPVPAIPDGIVIRPIIAGREEKAAARVAHEAFKDHWGHTDQPFEETWVRWKHRIETDETFDPALWFLALDGETIVGVTLGWTHLGEQTNLGWVGSVGVLREYRRRGIAEALLRHALGAYWARGQRRVGLGVDADSLTGATRLYEKCGMHIAHRLDVYRLVLREGEDLTTQSLVGQ